MRVPIEIMYGRNRRKGRAEGEREYKLLVYERDNPSGLHEVIPMTEATFVELLRDMDALKRRLGLRLKQDKKEE